MREGINGYVVICIQFDDEPVVFGPFNDVQDAQANLWQSQQYCSGRHFMRELHPVEKVSQNASNH
jgi:hypothetical protein